VHRVLSEELARLTALIESIFIRCDTRVAAVSLIPTLMVGEFDYCGGSCGMADVDRYAELVAWRSDPASIIVAFCRRIIGAFNAFFVKFEINTIVVTWDATLSRHRRSISDL